MSRSLSPALSGKSNAPPGPYNPYESYLKDIEPQTPDNRLALPYPSTTDHVQPPQSIGSGNGTSIANIYWTASAILGFKEKFSFLLCFVFGGALLGFSLARTEMMSPRNVAHLTVPGEWFWYRQSLYKPSTFLHIYCTIIATFFVVFQFIPAIRRRKMILHRANGYLVLLVLIPGIVSGSVVARRAFGGSPSTQSAFYLDGILIVFSAIKGYASVRETRKHRKWMLRAVTYLSAPITARIILITSREIISSVGGYYSMWTCAEVQFLQDRGQGVPVFTQTYPACANHGTDPSLIHVAVRASMHAYPVNFGSAVRETFGMALWIALVIHVLGVEIYIRATEASNMHRRGFVLERRDDGTAEKSSDDH
ncbi:hypothetical protein FRB94_000897 [Tulasnella sp. JGI-2019a]|nr:hypothetical protein FRB93_008163 [Tulasnella sp. JGI-2019a]KAG8988328.1 hypothetical protein FRB94_000897 [Tulasnella sp. JGI-2019a]